MEQRILQKLFWVGYSNADIFPDYVVVLEVTDADYCESVIALEKSDLKRQIDAQQFFKPQDATQAIEPCISQC